MNIREITSKEYMLLKEISLNHISLSAFSGMIFNSYTRTDDDLMGDRIIHAIRIKQYIKEMILKYETENFKKD